MSRSETNTISRGQAIRLLGSAALASFFPASLVAAPKGSLPSISTMNTRTIPSSSETLPVIGLGTWIQFDVGDSRGERSQLAKVLQEMQNHGGRVIDSSPMYGSAERVAGDLTQAGEHADDFFYATKVWTSGKRQGVQQMQSSMRKMRRSTMDLMQIHNLQDWRSHLKTLHDWKEQGLIRYIGITHYTNGSHSRLASIIRNHPIDFVQCNYSIAGRHAEQTVFRAAADKGVAVIVNRPYEGGSLFRRVKGKSLPEWVTEWDIASWGQFFLKFIISHPAVTCAIPGTSKPHHCVDNMLAGHGRIPDLKTREKMAKYLKSI